MSENPYAAPAAVVADITPSGEIMKADRGTRLAAAILDTLIMVAVLIPLFVSGVFSADGSFNEDAINGLAALSGLAFFALMVVNLVMLHKSGQTIAKKLLNIKIVRVDGSRASLRRIFFLRILVNSLLGAIPVAGGIYSLVDALFIFGEEKRCVHDYIAGTIVINA